MAFNPEHKKVLDAILLHIPGVFAGRMFGYPDYYTHGKLFACIYEEGGDIKVPERVADSLSPRILTLLAGMLHQLPQMRPIFKSRSREGRPVAGVRR